MEFLRDRLRRSPLYGPLKRLVWVGELLAWELGERAGPAPHLVKQKTVREYGRRFGLATLVETGTYMGSMVGAVMRDFRIIHSIELDRDLAERASKKFSRHRNVKIWRGDSAEVMREILDRESGRCLFWLDAHYSSGITARGDKETPIEQELSLIFGHRPDHVILIDDARCFTGQGDWPRLERIMDLAHNRNFAVLYDIIRIW